LGFVELCLLLEAVGQTVAPIPALATLVMGATPLAEFGTDEQRRRFLPPVAAGESILTAGLIEPVSHEPTSPMMTARKDGSVWRLDGVKTCVPAAHLAERILIAARSGSRGEVGLFLLDPRSSGVTLRRQVATSGEPQFEIELSGAAVAADEAIGSPQDGQRITDWLEQRVIAAVCAMQLGVTERALRMTAEYTSKREQFGKPIGSFQAVGQRAADAYIDVEAIRWTTWQAVWRLAQGLPAQEEVAIAKFWAAEGGHRVAYAAQHLHGGIGLDLDYPLHRSFVWAKQLELTLGAATHHLLRLGSWMSEATEVE
jgi:hypothetical protein